MGEARAVLDVAMTERAFQDSVIRLARLYNWRVYHVPDSRMCQAGWPDLTLWRPPRFLLAELKREHGRVTEEQRQCGLDGETQTMHVAQPDGCCCLEHAKRRRQPMPNNELMFTDKFQRALENLVEFLSAPESAAGMTEEEVDEELRRAGIDPEEVGQRMKALAEQTLAALRKEQ